jgi:PAS domain S-box-containing protein
LDNPILSDKTVNQVIFRALRSGQIAIAITEADGSDQVVWANSGFTRLTGYPLYEVLGRSHSLLHGPDTDRHAVARLYSGLRTADVAPLTALLFRKDGVSFWSRMIVTPIRDEDGKITHHTVIHHDVTADVVRQRAQAAQEALVVNRADRMTLNNRVVGAMIEHVDYHLAAEALASTAIPELADWGFVILFDDAGGPAYITRIAADPAKSQSARIVEPGLPHWVGSVAWAAQLPSPHQAFETGSDDRFLPRLVDVDHFAWTITSKHQLDALLDLGVGAQLAVPLHSRDQVTGLMMLEARNPGRFDVATVVTATQLCDRVSAVLADIRRYQAERPGLTLRTTEAGGRPGGEPDDVRPVPLAVSDGLKMAFRALQAAQMPIILSSVLTGQVVWANHPYCQMVGWTQDELIGRTWETMHTEQPDEAYAARMIDSLNAGSTVSMTLLNRRKDDTRFWSRMIVAPVRDGEGRITHVLGVHFDATGSVVAEHAQVAEAELVANRSSRLELITTVLDALTDRIGLHEAADALARTAIPELADWGFVVLFDDNRRPEHWSFAAADPAKLESLRAVEQFLPGWERSYPSMAAVLDAQPDDPILPDLVDLSLLARQAGEQMDVLTDLGLGVRLVVPLFARDRTLGVMVLEASDPNRFDTATVVTATLLRRRASVALDNVRLYQAERAAALTLQRQLMPSAMTVPDLDTAVAYQPSGNSTEIGGDWYDVFSLGERGTILAVGDVVGHDMTAAGTMGQLSQMGRVCTWTSGSPGVSLQTMVRALDGMQWDKMASAVCIRWQATPVGGHLEYTNLGHPAPFVRLPDGTVYQMPPAHCAPLGIHDPRVEVGQDELDLPAGSVVVLYTDGLVERRDRSLEDGLAALAQALRDAPDGTAAEIRDHLLTNLVHDRPEDDVCLLVVRGRST